MNTNKEDLLIIDRYNNLVLRVEDKLEEIAHCVVFETEEADIFNALWDYYFNTKGSKNLNKEIKIAIRDYYMLLGIEHQNQLRLMKDLAK